MKLFTLIALAIVLGALFLSGWGSGWIFDSGIDAKDDLWELNLGLR